MQHCVPVHAISFNCNDTEANQFLSDLAQATDGRYHYFSEKGIDADQPKSWEVQIFPLSKIILQNTKNTFIDLFIWEHKKNNTFDKDNYQLQNIPKVRVKIRNWKKKYVFSCGLFRHFLVDDRSFESFLFFIYLSRPWSFPA